MYYCKRNCSPERLSRGSAKMKQVEEIEQKRSEEKSR